MACELPASLVVPLSRLSVADVRRQVEQRGLVARISDSTVWRWLHEDAIRPWQHRCWIFPRDPDFQAKAARLLDLYARCGVQVISLQFLTVAGARSDAGEVA